MRCNQYILQIKCTSLLWRALQVLTEAEAGGSGCLESSLYALEPSAAPLSTSSCWDPTDGWGGIIAVIAGSSWLSAKVYSLWVKLYRIRACYAFIIDKQLKQCLYTEIFLIHVVDLIRRRQLTCYTCVWQIDSLVKVPRSVLWLRFGQVGNFWHASGSDPWTGATGALGCCLWLGALRTPMTPANCKGTLARDQW